MKKMFDSLCVHTDVTSVETFSNYIAAGIGGFLHIYELDTNTLIQKKEIFEGQKIYGIKPNSQASKLILYGGKNISLIPIQEKGVKINTSGNQHILSDWILEAKWLENNTKIATVFMHNKITIWFENFTSEISVKCEERCILYSAHICFDSYKQLLILSGTVFSEILLWKPSIKNHDDLSPVLKRLMQHKGVIFSIHCNLRNGLICTASDDRSAVLWRIMDPERLTSICPENSSMVQINIACQVYGHLSRVFRCLILDEFFITAGEDSLLIIWSFEGVLLRKIDTHQGGPVWSLCYSSETDIICSGGNDGAILAFRANPQIKIKTISLPISECPKIIGILNSGNMICLSENANLFYYITAPAEWKKIASHPDLQKYSLMQISPCNKMIALAGFEGQIYIYSEIDEILKLLHTYNIKNKTRIFSFHWINCNTFLVSQKDGIVILCFIYNGSVHYAQSFMLPPVKERWPTCVCTVNDHMIIGDRKGNIHNFQIGKQNPINSIKKAHSYLGVTSLYLDDSIIMSLGRDGYIKRYKFINDHLECIDSNKTKFSWLTGLEGNYLVSFSGDNFVISDFKFQRVLFETQCGGGHRSWDYKMFAENFVFSFIKQKTVHVIKLNLGHFTPKSITEGYHVREINSMKVLSVNGNHVIISGGEDTTLRFGVLQRKSKIKVLLTLKVHLSSIRSINIYPLPKSEEYLLFTGGGRGQIICWKLQFTTKNVDNLSLSCAEKYNFYESLNQDDAETRIMDLHTVNFQEQIFLLAGCSDGCIKVYLVLNDLSLQFQKSILYSHHSITKLTKINVASIELLGSMATNGCLVFWSVLDICACEKSVPLCSFKIHQSGITSCSYIATDKYIFFLSGGDDNCVILTLFELSKNANNVTVSKINACQNSGLHCAQITGTFLCGKYFVTSSIDQRIVISKWTSTEEQVNFRMLAKYDTAIADPQGLEIIFNEKEQILYIYGNGVECLKVEFGKTVEL